MEESDRTILARGLGWMIGWRFDGKRGSFDLWRGMVVIALVLLVFGAYVNYGNIAIARVTADKTLENTMSLSNQMVEVRADIGQLRRAMMLPPRQKPVIHVGIDGAATNQFTVTER